MRKALRILNKELVGQHHNALDDALNITEILKACLQKGVIIEKANGSKIFHCIY